MALGNDGLNREKYVKIFLAVGFIGLAARMIGFVAEHAVNLLYWDQWDFLGPFFDEKGLWDRFFYQHGPHRQGLGAIFLTMVYGVSGWNTRVECFMSSGLLIAAAAMFMKSKRQICGSWEWTDLFIPVSVLTLTQHELFTVTSNPAHGPIPSLLFALAFYLISLPKTWLSSLCLAVVSVCSTFTGFAFFNGLILPVLMLWRWLEGVKEQKNVGTLNLKKVVLDGLPTILAVSGTLLFFVNYINQPAALCFKFPHDRPVEYLQFSQIFFDNAFGNVSWSFVHRFDKGAVGFVHSLKPFYWILVIVFCVAGVRFFVRKDSRDPNAGIFYLASFSLLFGLFSAIGRVCIGVSTAVSSRYVPYAVPGMIAVYLAASCWIVSPRIRWVVLLILFAFSIRREVMFDSNSADIKNRVEGKRKWAQCYREHNHIATCDRISAFQVYPYPEMTQLQSKLDYLKEHRLNLFLD